MSTHDDTYTANSELEEAEERLRAIGAEAEERDRRREEAVVYKVLPERTVREYPRHLWFGGMLALLVFFWVSHPSVWNLLNGFTGSNYEVSWAAIFLGMLAGAIVYVFGQFTNWFMNIPQNHQGYAFQIFGEDSGFYRLAWNCRGWFLKAWGAGRKLFIMIVVLRVFILARIRIVGRGYILIQEGKSPEDGRTYAKPQPVSVLQNLIKYLFGAAGIRDANGRVNPYVNEAGWCLSSLRDGWTGYLPPTMLVITDDPDGGVYGIPADEDMLQKQLRGELTKKDFPFLKDKFFAPLVVKEGMSRRIRSRDGKTLINGHIVVRPGGWEDIKKVEDSFLLKPNANSGTKAEPPEWVSKPWNDPDRLKMEHRLGLATLTLGLKDNPETHNACQDAIAWGNVSGERGDLLYTQRPGVYPGFEWIQFEDVGPEVESLICRANEVLVVTSSVGLADGEVTDEEFEHGKLVRPWHRNGTWITPIMGGGPYYLNSDFIRTSSYLIKAVLWFSDSRNADPNANPIDYDLGTTKYLSKDKIPMRMDTNLVLLFKPQWCSRIQVMFGGQKQFVAQVIRSVVRDFNIQAISDHTVDELMHDHHSLVDELRKLLAERTSLHGVEVEEVLFEDVLPDDETEAGRKYLELRAQKTLTDQKTAVVDAQLGLADKMITLAAKAAAIAQKPRLAHAQATATTSVSIAEAAEKLMVVVRKLLAVNKEAGAQLAGVVSNFIDYASKGSVGGAADATRLVAVEKMFDALSQWEMKIVAGDFAGLGQNLLGAVTDVFGGDNAGMDQFTKMIKDSGLFNLDPQSALGTVTPIASSEPASSSTPPPKPVAPVAEEPVPAPTPVLEPKSITPPGRGPKYVKKGPPPDAKK